MVSKIKSTFCILLVLLFVFTLFSSNVLASQNLAYSVATQSGGINTIQMMNDAAYSYLDTGYHTYGVTDPEPGDFNEYLYADVQFFVTHGGTDNVQFSKTGICVGNTKTLTIDGVSKKFWGTNSINWSGSGTLLVTYLSCNDAGVNNTPDRNSISYKTAERGAQVTLGFREEIVLGSAENWAKRYNERLGQGYGVDDAVKYADSFIYITSGIKTGHIWHHGDPNIKIGKYRSSNLLELEDERIIGLKQEKSSATINNITETIKSIDNSFNIENYDVNLSNFTSGEVGSDEITTEATFIDLQLKIGEYKTEAGYTIEMKNGEIINIYDNNIDIEKQNQLLRSKNNELNESIENNIVSQLKVKAIQSVEDKYNNEVIVKDNEVESTYFYDLNTDKKYIIFTVPNTLKGNMAAKSISEVRYEI